MTETNYFFCARFPRLSGDDSRRFSDARTMYTRASTLRTKRHPFPSDSKVLPVGEAGGGSTPKLTPQE